MSYSRGESMATGVAIEAVRGTAVEPQDFVRTREPANINVELEKTPIQETKETGMSSQGDVIVSSEVTGDLSLNLRFRTLGYFLKSLLGGLTTSVEAGESAVYRHSFSLDTAILQPSMTIAQARAGFQHKEVNGAVVSKLGLEFVMDDLIKGSIGIMGRQQADHADYTEAFASDDYNAPHQMVEIKLATNVAGLAGATAICVTDAKIDFNRGTRKKQCMSSIYPTDFIAKLLEISGSFTMEKSDDTYKTLAEANTQQALQIKVINTNVDMGVVTTNPELTIVLPNVTLAVAESRPLDDIVTEDITFMAHYDDAEASGVNIDLVNEKADYNAT